MNLESFRGDSLLLAVLLTALVFEAATQTRSAQADGFSASLSAFEVQNDFASTSTVSAPEGARFARGSLLFINESSHPLMQRVGSMLLKKLEGGYGIAQVEYRPAGKSRDRGQALADGARAPDLFLRLELKQLKEEGWVSRAVSATITATLGASPWQSNHSFTDDTTPPIIHYAWNGELRHNSTLKGFETPKYKSASESIANELAKAITNQLEKIEGEYTALPPLPDALFGPFHPAPALPFLQELKAGRAFSYYGLFTHNETFWKMQLSSNPVPRLESIAQQLSSQEWKVQPYDFTNTSACFLRAQKSGASLEVFSSREPATLASDPKSSEPVEFIVHFREPFTRKERTNALEQLLSQDTPLETMLAFESYFHTRQRDRFYARLEQNPPVSPEAQLSLARLYLQRKDMGKAIEAAKRTKALLSAEINPVKVSSRLDDLVKRISPKETLPLELSREDFKTAGFEELKPSLTVEKKAGEPLALFSIGEDGVPQTFCLRVQPKGRNGSAQTYSWTSIETRASSRSTLSSSFQLPEEASWTNSFSFRNSPLHFVVTPLTNRAVLRYSIRNELP